MATIEGVARQERVRRTYKGSNEKIVEVRKMIYDLMRKL
jgi:hypothetical protein